MCNKCSLAIEYENKYTVSGFLELTGICEECTSLLKAGDVITDLDGAGKWWSCNECCSCHKIGVSAVRYLSLVFCEGCKYIEIKRKHMYRTIVENGLYDLYNGAMQDVYGNNVSLDAYIMFGVIGDELPKYLTDYIKEFGNPSDYLKR